jgi:anaerobic magnesium-protoporphyrin IX monomethyl ester cyclase
MCTGSGTGPRCQQTCAAAFHSSLKSSIMIILVNPRATRPSNRRFPLSIMAVGAAIPEGEDWEIVDGNLPGMDVVVRVGDIIEARRGTQDPVRAVCFTVMPGPQLASAVGLTQKIKARYPDIPTVWGGNFPSLYPEPVLNAPYIDWMVRGQGEQTFIELLDVLGERRDPEKVSGLCFRHSDGSHHKGIERPWVGPNDLPPPPYHKIDVGNYLRPTFLGKRSGVYQASIGCPHSCNFCGVISVYGRKEKMQAPARTAEHLAFLARTHGMDSVHFYDNNFFLREDVALELAERLIPLNIRWWCEGRVDAMLRFSDRTWHMLKRSGLEMVFFGAESGSDESLKKMQKGITTAQVLEAAARSRQHGIIPEFSFVFGDPDEPEREIETTLGFIRKLKAINPLMEMVTHFYTPMPQRQTTYGGVDPLAGTPLLLEDWTTPDWIRWMTFEDPNVPWLNQHLKARVEDFEFVLKSRFPSIHDRRTRGWGKMAGRMLAKKAWNSAEYSKTKLLRNVMRLARSEPPDKQAYGHLRDPSPAAPA